MASDKKNKVALVRGDNLGEWEVKLFEGLDNDFEITAFRGFKNVYKYKKLALPIQRLFSSQDNFFLKNIHKYFFGQYKVMYGLEKKLASFDIAHTLELYNFSTTQAVRAKKINKDLKVVVYVADNTFGRFEYNYWPGFKSPPKYWRNKINNIIKENINGTDAFQAVTRQSAELLKDYGAPEEKIRIINPGIVVMPEQELDLKKITWLLEKMVNRRTYLMVSRLTKEKGIYEALYGWRLFLRRVNNKNNNNLLLIFGDGPEKQNLLRLISELGLNDSVLLTPYLDNQLVRFLYKQAWCLILDSLPTSVWQEQFGYVLGEAIVSECPVVAASSGAIPEVVGEAGLLFSPGNAVELANKLIELNDLNLHQQLKNNCRLAKNKFSQEEFVNKIKALYLNLLK